VAVLPHGLCDLRPLDVPLQPPFFVSNAPEDDGRVVAVPLYHTFQEPDMFLVYAGKTVLLQYQDTQTVTGIDHLRSHGVVAGTVGVDTQFLHRVKDGVNSVVTVSGKLIGKRVVVGLIGGDELGNILFGAVDVEGGDVANLVVIKDGSIDLNYIEAIVKTVLAA
jgi:hypothetical protein